ncbi:MAG: HAD hydrolase family protein [Bryobacterales bacterium]|nr:HAD hydrolase family protein [Bryobacterales bacterium]
MELTPESQACLHMAAESQSAGVQGVPNMIHPDQLREPNAGPSKGNLLEQLRQDLRRADCWNTGRNTTASFAVGWARAKFGAVVFDYDGTLCHSVNRFDGIRNEVATALNQLLEDGILIGIATGRGGSVQKDISRHLTESLQVNVLIGYHNQHGNRSVNRRVSTTCRQPGIGGELEAGLDLLAKDSRVRSFQN